MDHTLAASEASVDIDSGLALAGSGLLADLVGPESAFRDTLRTTLTAVLVDDEVLEGMLLL